MGCPLGYSPFPRYLAQYLALVPRAHKAYSGRKVSNSDPARPGTAHILTATCLMTPRPIHAHVTAQVPQVRQEGRKGFPPRETRVLQQRGSPLIPQRRTRGFMPGLFANDLMLIPLSVHFLSFVWTLGYRLWGLLSRSFGSCWYRFSCLARQARVDDLRRISGG